MNSQSNSFWNNATTQDWSFQASTTASTEPIPWQFGSPGPSSGFAALRIAPEAPTPSPSTPPTRGAMGYFAFSPNSFSHSSAGILDSETQRREQDNIEARQKQKAEEDRESAWQSRLKREAEVHQQRVAREEAEARRGEEEWVRSGGILRDAGGRRDMVKTQAVRDELKLREIEAGLVRRWEEYERRWKELSTTGTSKTKATVTFQDIPWPVDVGTRETLELGDLNVEKVQDFLLAGLKVRGNRVTKKDRVRSSLLRWHPDKMTAVLARVVHDDREVIKQGISVVMACLQELNAKL